MLSNIIRPDFPLLDIEYDSIIIELNDLIEKTIKETAPLHIEGAGDVLTISHYLKMYKHFTKRGEEIRKKCVDPFNSAVKEVNLFFKKIYERYSAEEARLANELLAYNNMQLEAAQEKRREFQKQLEEAALRKAIEVEEMQKAEALKKRIPFAEIKQIEIPEIPEVKISSPKLSSCNLSGIATARIKKWRVADFNAIPRSYLAVNETLVASVRKDYDFETESPIPGIEFYFETVLR
jgi:hypothetical protein